MEELLVFIIGKVEITIDADRILLALGATATGVAIFAGTVIGREPIISFFSSFFGGGVKNACIQYKEEMTAHSNSNPVMTGNYNNFTDSVFQEWNAKGDEINKRLFSALGINYISGESRGIEEVQSNVAGLMKAAQECYNAGVDFGGMKELKEFSKGLRQESVTGNIFRVREPNILNRRTHFCSIKRYYDFYIRLLYSSFTNHIHCL